MNVVEEHDNIASECEETARKKYTDEMDTGELIFNQELLRNRYAHEGAKHQIVADLMVIYELLKARGSPK